MMRVQNYAGSGIKRGSCGKCFSGWHDLFKWHSASRGSLGDSWASCLTRSQTVTVFHAQAVKVLSKESRFVDIIYYEKHKTRNIARATTKQYRRYTQQHYRLFDSSSSSSTRPTHYSYTIALT